MRPRKREGGAAALRGCHWRRTAALILPVSETPPKATGTDFKELISHLRFSAIETTGLRG